MHALARLTSQASLNEKHLWFSTQTLTVDIIEVLRNVEDADGLGVTGIEHSKFAMRQETTYKCIKVGMISAWFGQKQPLQCFHRQIRVNLHFKLQFFEQLLQHVCQFTQVIEHHQQDLTCYNSVKSQPNDFHVLISDKVCHLMMTKLSSTSSPTFLVTRTLHECKLYPRRGTFSYTN